MRQRLPQGAVAGQGDRRDQEDDRGARGLSATADDPFAGPGWHVWDIKDETRFNGGTLAPLTVRRDPDGKARLRMLAEHRHTNLSDNIHGGAILALIDVALFATAKLHSLRGTSSAVSLDVNVQFIAAGRPNQPLDAVGEVLSETRRLVFVRGLVVQGETTVAAFSGTVRKYDRR